MPDQGHKILVLGGTGPARRVTELLMEAGHHAIYSLAGVTANPALPEAEIRTGGFGGTDGLAAYIASQGIGLIVDATHPFAARISAQAVEAAEKTGIRCLRLERPAWEPREGDRWYDVPDIEAAAEALLPEARPFLTIGRQELQPFLKRKDINGIARMIEQPEYPLPKGWALILDRPPFAYERERNLMKTWKISVLVTKNAGGPARAKLDVARDLQIPVLMIARPDVPPTETAASPEDVVALI